MEITKKAKQQLTASPAIIDLQGIVKRFYIGKPNELEILHGIDLQVQEGQFVSIVGESGSGKSTLMNIIGALDQPTGGQYLLDGECVDNLKDKQLSEIRNQKIGFVFQTYNLIPRTSALANVELPMLYAGVTRKERTERAKELLEQGTKGSIQEIAAAVGYDDAYHFSKLFKKRYGIPPSRIRKKS